MSVQTNWLNSSTRLAKRNSAEAATPRSEATVPEGINAGFEDPQLDMDEWLDRLEVESREVYIARCSGVTCIVESRGHDACSPWG